MRKYFKVLPAATVLLLVAACGSDTSTSKPATTTPATTATATSTAVTTTPARTTVAPTTVAPAKTSSYATTAFTVPLDVEVPSWLPPVPIVDQPNLVTWETIDGAQAVRVIVPVSVYQPGSTTPTTPPKDYLAYLLAQVDQGAHFTDVVKTTVGGKPATIVTANTDKSLDGSIGCAGAGQAAPACFGLQPDLSLRIAVIDTGEQPLLMWLRRGSGDTSTASLDSFTQMLASVRLSERAPEQPTAPASAATPIDGIWTNDFTYDELKNSPLLEDLSEVNDGNWGHNTMTLQNGHGSIAVANPRMTSSNAFTYTVVADTITMVTSGADKFVMRWKLDGDRLVLSRDDRIGIAPTPNIIKPWTRQP